MIGFVKPYMERYVGILDGLIENPLEETPGWHASELETSQEMAWNPELVRMERPSDTRASIPDFLPELFHKSDGAPDVEFEAAQNRFVAQSLQQIRRRVQRFWLQEPHFDGRLRTCSQDHVALAQAMLDSDGEVVSQTVHAHIDRLRLNVLARLESAGPLLPVRDPLAVVGRQLSASNAADGY